MLKTLAAIFIAGAAALLPGCVMPQQRADVTLAIPPSGQESYPVTKSTVILVRLVTDERAFGHDTGASMMLSLTAQNDGGAPPELRPRIYARKCDAVGKPLENVLLEEGQTAATVVRDNLVAGFRQAGYRVTVNPAEAGFSPVQVNVHVTRFWSWYDRKRDHDTLHATIETTLDTSVAPTPIMVAGQAEYVVGRENPGTWVEVLNRALADYRTRVGAKFAYLP